MGRLTVCPFRAELNPVRWPVRSSSREWRILGPMKLLSWNIRQGGGKLADRIVAAISSHDPDVVALIEYRSAPGKELCRMLAEGGWKYIESTTQRGRDNGLCVVSRTPLRRKIDPSVPPEFAVRWLDADVPSYGFGIGVLHIPGSSRKVNGAAKSRFWDAVLSAAQSRRDTPFVFIGDLNTGAHRIDEAKETFHCAEHFGRMTNALGWIDLWRAFNWNTTEYTWYSRRKGGVRGNGFRLDHAFASPALRPRVVDCRYSHFEREAGTSDHSVLAVEIADA